MAQHGGGFWFETLSESEIVRAESRLGRRLPSLLRAAYSEIGNGGFGPGYGLLPLILVEAPPGHETVVDIYLAFRGSGADDPAWSWPDNLVPFCDWGCAIRSCVDCASPDGAVFTFDPNTRHPNQDMSTSLAATHSSLDAWFRDWIEGVRIRDLMFQPDEGRARVIVNPFTRKPIRVVPTKLRRSLDGNDPEETAKRD
jgi:SMI1/KNR4 family protein SUKH-1